VPHELKQLIENVRYKGDIQSQAPPSELEAKRVQNIIIQEVGKAVNLTYPKEKYYGRVPLPEGTETGKNVYSPPKDVPRNTPPFPVSGPTVVKPSVKDEKKSFP
jgi:hypothetical protein